MILGRREIVIPDLRFEQVFRKALDNYADKANVARRELSAKELQYEDEEEVRETLPPVEPSLPSIVTYAVIRDIMLRPLVEGFLWALICILARPALRLVTRQGWRVGTMLASLVGIRPAV